MKCDNNIVAVGKTLSQKQKRIQSIRGNTKTCDCDNLIEQVFFEFPALYV